MTNELQPSPPDGPQSPFERIRRTNAAGVEYWSSRDFAQVLGYADYRNFEQVIQKAKIACFNSAAHNREPFRLYHRNGRNRQRREGPSRRSTSRGTPAT